MNEMNVNGGQRSKFIKFKKDVHEQVKKGIPLFWGVMLGIYPSWGAGRELKRMPADWAWTITRSLMYMKPLSR